MGEYLNPTNDLFGISVNSEIYVDKTGLITETNKLLCTENRFVCISRPRRFGKSMAAAMLAAYYGRGCDSKEIFSKLKIGSDPSFEAHLNHYNVIFLNMTAFTSGKARIYEAIADLQETVEDELSTAYPEAACFGKGLIRALQGVYSHYRIPFVFIIDEWDCVFREHKTDKTVQETYLAFLRDLLKDKAYVALAYMTGILPIKKYGTHSTLNMFAEYSMTDPAQFVEYVGFTGSEVKALCGQYEKDIEEISKWFNGYRFPGCEAVYNPHSVVESLVRGRCGNYWNRTETYEALAVYIKMNFDGLKDAIVKLMAGDRQRVNVNRFSNDMTSLSSCHDVLTLLVHLGYLGYDIESKEVFVPNNEIYDEFATAVSDTDWGEVIRAVEDSDALLKATWRKDAATVAEMIQMAHMETSILTYNDENALSYTVSLAYYNAREYYTLIREMPSGKGFADLVFLPRTWHADKPAMIVELKWDKTAEGAISQIEDKGYLEVLKGYRGQLLLVGLNYRKDNKQHECVIKEKCYAAPMENIGVV